MAQIIKTTGEVTEVEPAKGKYFSLEEMQIIVGGYIEVVRISNNEIMIVNEEGKLDNLPINKKATEIASIPGDVIVGDVLVCNRNQMD